ncbi:hypothetical protein CURTO8I2_150063 [Curtobacterium sp. 8I-2]|nr:hypothetical protein CURTO8I2_150063 [Curtobacterium sp. 8I-2]
MDMTTTGDLGRRLLACSGPVICSLPTSGPFSDQDRHRTHAPYSSVVRSHRRFRRRRHPGRPPDPTRSDRGRTSSGQRLDHGAGLDGSELRRRHRSGHAGDPCGPRVADRLRAGIACAPGLAHPDAAGTHLARRAGAVRRPRRSRVRAPPRGRSGPRLTPPQRPDSHDGPGPGRPRDAPHPLHQHTRRSADPEAGRVVPPVGLARDRRRCPALRGRPGRLDLPAGAGPLGARVRVDRGSCHLRWCHPVDAGRGRRRRFHRPRPVHGVRRHAVRQRRLLELHERPDGHDPVAVPDRRPDHLGLRWPPGRRVLVLLDEPHGRRLRTG